MEIRYVQYMKASPSIHPIPSLDERQEELEEWEGEGRGEFIREFARMQDQVSIVGRRCWPPQGGAFSSNGCGCPAHRPDYPPISRHSPQGLGPLAANQISCQLAARQSRDGMDFVAPQSIPAG